MDRPWSAESPSSWQTAKARSAPARSADAGDRHAATLYTAKHKSKATCLVKPSACLLDLSTCAMQCLSRRPSDDEYATRGSRC